MWARTSVKLGPTCHWSGHAEISHAYVWRRGTAINAQNAPHPPVNQLGYANYFCHLSDKGSHASTRDHFQIIKFQN